MAKAYNVYITGVGGQGIGLLAEVLARAAGHAGLEARGCDTHGLAQRGGAVSSFLRLGPGAHSPLFPEGEADLVLALERCEAYRAAQDWLAPGGTLVWYDTSWQPLPVRLGGAAAVLAEDVAATCGALGAMNLRLAKEGLGDARMQNSLLVRALSQESLIPGLEPAHYRAALADLMEGKALEANLALLKA